jgi:hypothetical protein
MQPVDPATVINRDHPTGRAAVQRLVGLHLEHQPVLDHGRDEDVHALDTKDPIGPGAARRIGPTRRKRSSSQPRHSTEDCQPRRRRQESRG